jgi:putative flavoprotein involved in K+ transport
MPRVANVVWRTEFQPGFSRIGLAVFGAAGAPTDERGAMAREPGQYFVGLHVLHAVSPTVIRGVGYDAAHAVDIIATTARGADAAA